MGKIPVSREALVCFLVIPLFAAVIYHGNNSKTVEVMEHMDFSVTGLRVMITCKPENGNGGLKTRGTIELDVEGKFKIILPDDIVDEYRKLKEECYVHHSASGGPCPAYDGLGSSEHAFGLAKNTKLIFSPATRASLYRSPPPPPVPSEPPPVPRPSSHVDASVEDSSL